MRVQASFSDGTCFLVPDFENHPAFSLLLLGGERRISITHTEGISCIVSILHSNLPSFNPSEIYIVSSSNYAMLVCCELWKDGRQTQQTKTIDLDPNLTIEMLNHYGDISMELECTRAA